MATLEEIEAEIARRQNIGATGQGASLQDIESRIGQLEQQRQVSDAPSQEIDEQSALRQFMQTPTGARVRDLFTMLSQPGFAGDPRGIQRAVDFAAPIASSIVAEPIAGVAGIAATPFVGAEAGDVVEQTREALTVAPQTGVGQRALGTVGEVLEPAGEGLQAVESGLGDAAFKATGSPAFAAAATTLPTAVLEILGLGAGRKVAQTATGLPRAPGKVRAPQAVKQRAVTKTLLESAPEVDQLKDASRAIFREIDDLNVVARPRTLENFVRRTIMAAGKTNPKLHPKSHEVTRLLRRELQDPTPRKLSDFQELRELAADAAGNVTDPKDALKGAQMLDEIDNFLDELPRDAFIGPDKKALGQVGERYRAARGLWGRARRAEVISEAFDKAGRAENPQTALKSQFRQILNNKRRRKFFSKDELQAMDDVVKGATTENILKAVGRFGFTRGAAQNVLGGLLGSGVASPAIPVAGELGRIASAGLTQRGASNMEALIRGGANAKRITRAYLQSVPKAKRSTMELSDLLLSSGQEVDDLLTNSNRVIKEAAEITRARRIFDAAQTAGAAAPLLPEAVQQEQE